MGLWSGLFAGCWSSFTTNSSSHAFMDLALLQGHSHAGTGKGLPHKVGSIQLYVFVCWSDVRGQWDRCVGSRGRQMPKGVGCATDINVGGPLSLKLATELI